MEALIIIDMQKGSFTPETPRFDSNQVVNRINALIKYFRNIKSPIIFIQHNGSATKEYIPNTTEWELLDELEIKSSDIIIEKYANDAFYRTTLNDKLIELNVTELYITGCATDFCVESTIQSALVKDYNLIIVKNAHTTGDRPHIKAKKIVQHYNWIWENMTPTKGNIILKDAEDIISEA